jgi:type 1 glutamine amidotransferase
MKLRNQQPNNMQRSKMRYLGAAVLASAIAIALVPGPTQAQTAPTQEPQPIKVLVYSATYGFRHASIGTARSQFEALGATDEFDVTLTEDPSEISKKGLADFDVVVFANATGEHPFSEKQRRDFLDWLADGGGFVGTHASADGNYYWSDYGDIVGAYFLAHPHTGVATNVIEDPDSPFMSHFTTDRYDLNEEYYRFQLDPRANVHVLSSLDRSTAGPEGNSYFESQPTTWCQEIGGGRSFYTAWGHFDESFTNPDVWQMLQQGVRWAAGRLEADCSPTEALPAGHLEAEDAVQVATGWKESSPVEGAEQVVTGILHRGYLKFEDVDLTGAASVKANVSPETAPEPRPYHYPVAQPAAGGTITIRLDAVDGPEIGTLDVGAGIPAWKVVEADLTETPTGSHDVYLVFSEDLSGFLELSRIVFPEATDSRYLMSVDWIEFVSPSVSEG